MLKRFIAFLLAFLMLFSLVACTGDGEGTEAPAGSENASETGAENTEKVEVPVEITAEMLAEYTLRRPENVKGESITVTIEAAKKLAAFDIDTVEGINVYSKDSHKCTINYNSEGIEIDRFEERPDEYGFLTWVE